MNYIYVAHGFGKNRLFIFEYLWYPNTFGFGIPLSEYLWFRIPLGGTCVYLIMGGSAVAARSAKGQTSVSTVDNAVAARSAEAAASANMDGSAISAWRVEGQASVSTGGGALFARSAEAPASVGMGGGAMHTWSAQVFILAAQ